MKDLLQLQSILADTYQSLITLQKLGMTPLSAKELKATTATLKEASQFLEEVTTDKEGSIKLFSAEQKSIKKILKNIVLFKQTTLYLIKEKKITRSDQNLIKVVEQLQLKLKELSLSKIVKHPSRSTKSKLLSFAPSCKLKKAPLNKAVNHPIQLRGKINKQDLNQNLSAVDQKLELFQHELSFKNKIPAIHYKRLTAIVKKADKALVKSLNFDQTLAIKLLTHNAQKVMTRILKEIAFIQNRLDVQIRTGTAQSLASLFNQTLDDLKMRLLVLKNLRLGKQVAATEHETHSGKK